MFNNFTVKIQTLKELAWQDFRDLFTWPSKSTIQAENPNLLIAKATNSSGEVVVYMAAEPILLVDGYVFAPQSTPDVSGQAGDAIDTALAQRSGTQRIWIVIPDDVQPVKGEKFIRVVERNVFQPVTNAHIRADSEVKQQPSSLN